MIKIIKTYCPEIVIAENNLTFGMFSEEEMEEVIIPQLKDLIEEFYKLSGRTVSNITEEVMDTREFDSVMEEKKAEKLEVKTEPEKKKTGKPKKTEVQKPTDEEVIEGFLESSDNDIKKAAFKYGMWKRIKISDATKIIERYMAGERIE